MLGAILNETINKRGLSYRAAAKEMGVSHTTLINLSKNVSVDLATVIAACKWLGVSPADALNSMLPEGTTSMLASVALLIEREPRLNELFTQAVENVKQGNLEPAELADIVNYAAYRLSKKRNG